LLSRFDAKVLRVLTSANRVAMFTGVHFANTGAAPPTGGGAADD